MEEEIKNESEISNNMVKLIIETNKSNERTIRKFYHLDSENKEVKSKIGNLETDFKVLQGRLELEIKDKILEIRTNQKDITLEIKSIQKEFETEIRKLNDMISKIIINQKEYEVENKKLKDKLLEIEESINNNKSELLSNSSKTSSIKYEIRSSSESMSNKTNTEFTYQEICDFFEKFVENYDVENKNITYKDKKDNRMEEKLFDLITGIIYNGKMAPNISNYLNVIERKLYDDFYKHIYKKNEKRLKEKKKEREKEKDE